MLIAFLGLIALVNLGLGKFGTSLQAIFGWILAPVAYLMGVPWQDCRGVGGLLGTRTVLNELIAFQELGKLNAEGQLLTRSFTIASFALCGFANFSSIGIQLGGIGALAPSAGTTWRGWVFVLYWPERWPIFSRLALLGYCYESDFSRYLVARATRRPRPSGPPFRKYRRSPWCLAPAWARWSRGWAIGSRSLMPACLIFRCRPWPATRATWSPATLTGPALIVLQGRFHYYEGHSLRGDLSHPGASGPGRSHPDSHGGHRRHPGRSAARQPGLPVGPSQPDRVQPPARPARRPPRARAFRT